MPDNKTEYEAMPVTTRDANAMRVQQHLHALMSPFRVFHAESFDLRQDFRVSRGHD